MPEWDPGPASKIDPLFVLRDRVAPAAPTRVLRVVPATARRRETARRGVTPFGTGTGTAALEHPERRARGQRDPRPTGSRTCPRRDSEWIFATGVICAGCQGSCDGHIFDAPVFHRSSH
ncbi:hypothetical protein ANANG_G00062670 [Anguilla anguilla]|uniref:Uncharacterized protein n=1 Tax=Anguilla anguilla TaxID=7936 RepID=A0A9D3S746_ANGAN|nr:hypothetical protein ANANG_G00062670 [Anguilla anguilla]